MSDIPKARFEVGEEVLVRPPANPEFNIDDATIIEAHYKKEASPYWRYKLNVDISPYDWVREISLRKKYRPGDSFSQLMANLKNPSKVWEES